MNKVDVDPKLPVDDKTLRIRLQDFLKRFATSINQAADLRLFQFRAITGTESTGENDHVILIAPSGTATVTLPAASSMVFKRVVVKRTNNTTHTITVQASAGNIDGSASVTLTTAYQSREFYSDGSNYWLV